ncbi:protein-L-isoaspartate O-methyltransferase family protein [Sneathiella chinensis]|uniref:Protein-L-isoaspartate O-methyltransferase n=1 Tax=Sneathiella chinensis TaxID=349750 RepID=A0ABQ5U8H9_9PROT|nr:protein-L-isoaspartate O-methyltransferase [Sneathiella chinensis]GLQ07495.1 protein-L-isoaspartate O-methyltransferase [Sneathiella chinensis]
MTENFAEARLSMVLSQLRPNNVTSDRVADAMNTVPREEFVPKDLRGVAYMDEDLAIAEGRYLIEPRVFARLLQEARVEESDVVLDVAVGTGYSSAVLGELAQAVVAIESTAGMVEKASEILTRLEADNVAVVEGNLQDGNAKQGPYNVIHVNGAIPAVPQALLDQLADGGRLICVIGTNPGVATVIYRKGDRFHDEQVFDAAVPALPELRPAEEFSF